MNKFKLSAIASTVLLSAAVFTGCGSSSAGSIGGSTASSFNAADGYVIKLASEATATCGDKSYTTSLSGQELTEGKITFSDVTLDSSCTISVPADAIIDVNNNGVFDDGIDKEAGFVMKAAGDAKYVSHLTTLVIAKKENGDTTGAVELAALVNNYDPVTAASSVASSSTSAADKIKLQNLMILGEVAKTVLSSATTTAASKINTSTFTSSSTIIDSTAISNALSDSSLSSVKTAAEQKAGVISDVVKILDTIDTTKINLNTLVSNMSDGGKTLSDAIVASAKTGVTVTSSTLNNVVTSGDLQTTATSIDTKVNTANTSVSTLPPKLNLGTILKAGTKEITLNGDSFSTTISSANADLSDFFSVVLPSASLSKDVATLNTQTVSLSIELIDKDNTADTAKLTVSGIQLSLATANSNDVKITIPSGVTVSATQTGLTGLSTIGNGATVTATTGSALENTDFSFNINTLVNTIGGTEIGTAITELNTYFKQANVYTVKVTLTGNTSSEVVIDNNIITGTVTVTN